MQAIRFLQLSQPRQKLIQLCQRVNHGAIVDIAVKNGEVDLDNPPSVLLDFHLANEVRARSELELRDFTLPAESSRLLAHVDFLQDGILERITVFEGVPRRVIVRRTLSNEAVL